MRQERGFTITELMFAMTFVAILLLILITTTIQLTNTYNKGITLKRVNQSGRTVGEELQRAIQHTSGVINLSVTNNRMCFGSTSFVWIQPDTPPPSAVSYNKYTDNATIGGLVKVHGQNLCLNAQDKIERGKAVQLLDDGLVLRQMSLQPTPSSQLVSVRYTISTPGESLISCGGDDNFCALNRFDVTVYARGY